MGIIYKNGVPYGGSPNATETTVGLVRPDNITTIVDENGVISANIPDLETTEVSDSTPYLSRASEHDALYDELIGGSVAWNQLVQNGNFTNTDSWSVNGGNLTVSANVGTLTTTATTVQSLTQQITNGVVNHTYFVELYVKASDSCKYAISLNTNTVNTNTIKSFTDAPNSWTKVSVIGDKSLITTVENFGFRIATNSTSTLPIGGTLEFKNIKVIDLTQMFGTTIADYVYSLEQATAGSGIDWLRSYGFFTEDYYDYDAGSLKSVNVSGKKIVGKNQIKLEADSTTINGVTFTVDKENGTVTVNGTASANAFFYTCNFYPKSNFSGIISGCPSGGANATYRLDSRNRKNGLVDPPLSYDIGTGSSVCDFIAGEIYGITIRINSGYTCNNLVFKPMIRRADVTDSTFEPYTELVYPLQSTDLRGLFKLDANNKLYTEGDIYPADGTITRKYGIVDLGTLTWIYTSGDNSRFTASSGGLAKPVSAVNIIANIICSKYMMAASADLYAHRQEKVIAIHTNGNIWVYDSSYTDAATFKSAMSGVYLIYELATPTTETVASYTSPQLVYRNGTEEYIDTRAVPIPVGGNRTYVDIPDCMTNRYFDDVRKEVDLNAQELDTKLDKTGDTMTGTLTLAADPTENYQAATKHYVDTAIAAELGNINSILEEVL